MPAQSASGPPAFGSQEYYAAAILETLDRVRRLRDAGTRATLDAALSGAMRIGYLAAEWDAKGWPDLQLGRTNRRTLKLASEEAAKERQRVAAELNERPIKIAAAAYRAQHPYNRRTHSTRKLATSLARTLDVKVNIIRDRLQALKIS